MLRNLKPWRQGNCFLAEFVLNNCMVFEKKQKHFNGLLAFSKISEIKEEKINAIDYILSTTIQLFTNMPELHDIYILHRHVFYIHSKINIYAFFSIVILSGFCTNSRKNKLK